MRQTSKTNGVAGNCCCLAPVLILLLIILAAVIGFAVVWHGAMPGVFGWGPRHHHYDAYNDGYQEGNRLGAAYARRGDPEPAGRDLDELARREADRLHVRRDRGHWIEGFRSGFARGFEGFNSSALNEPATGDYVIRWAALRAPYPLYVNR